MQIHGFNKTTLLDYPGLVASTIFTGSCNFRCPFCQNSDLVLDPMSQPLIPTEEVLAHLNKRKGIVKGVCITGGEPTLQADLRDFVKLIKEQGVLVKLDTNGYQPEVLIQLIEEGLLDYVAMDIKSSLRAYESAAGVSIDTSRIIESVEYLKRGTIPYEFRTTVVRELHNQQIMIEISDLLKGSKQYFLQSYVDSERVLQRGYTSYSPQEMREFLPLFQDRIDRVELRGLDEG